MKQNRNGYKLLKFAQKIFADLFVDCRERGGFVDFHGNRNEVSAAFHYRIYDKALIERIRTAVAPIVERSRKK